MIAGTFDFFEIVKSYSALEERLRGGSSYRKPIIDIDRLSSQDTLLMFQKIRRIYQIAFSLSSQKLPTDEQLSKIVISQEKEGRNSPRSCIKDLISELDKIT